MQASNQPDASQSAAVEMAAAVPIRIDFVSDVSCPWCAVGLLSLEQALASLGDAVTADIHFQPFELNPRMPPEGEDATEHLRRKYRSTPEQLERNRAVIRLRGEALGFTFNPRERIYNTFDAHRLLHWAGLDVARARQILASDDYAADVRAQQRYYGERGINAVPSVIINKRHLIQGGQPVEVFENALRRIAGIDGSLQTQAVSVS
jgi:predicted DsbA family dithiol-disulfide isomerase